MKTQKRLSRITSAPKLVRRDTLMPKNYGRVIQKLTREEQDQFNLKFVTPVQYENRPEGWKTFFLGLVAPYENRYKAVVNDIVHSTSQEVEVAKKRYEMEEALKERRLKQMERATKRNKRRRRLETRDEIEEEIQKEIDILKYVQGLSEKINK